MIPTVVTPGPSRYSITSEFPESYSGKEIEVIALQKEEGISQEKPPLTRIDFWGIISDETAEEMHKKVTKSKDWENRISRQF